MDATSTSGGPAVLVVTAPERYGPERTYVLDVVLREWLGLDYELRQGPGQHVAIRLHGDPQERELTIPDVLFATPEVDWLTERSLPARPLARVDPVPAGGPAGTAAAVDGRSLPVLFGEPDASDAPWRATAGGIALAVDVLGGAFWLLARAEEVIVAARDAHDRFVADASLAAAEGFVGRPIVDEYVDLLWAAIHALWPRLARRPTAFRLRPTHDVDQPWTAVGHGARAGARSVIGDLAHRRDLGLAARRVRAIVDARSGRVDRDPLNAFDFFMDTSERHGLRSTFYFMAGNEPADYDFRYRLTDPWFAPILRRIHARGHEIGLHASYVSHGSPERLAKEFAALLAATRAAGVEQETWGVRQHYLRFANPMTWRSHEAAGLEHDSTLGFAEQVGFRAGTCREFPLFDVLGRRPFRLRERPLIVMDGTLLAYLGLGLPGAEAAARAVIGECRRHAGDAVLLYHNSTIPGGRLRRHYRDLVDDLSRPA